MVADILDSPGGRCDNGPAAPENTGTAREGWGLADLTPVYRAVDAGRERFVGDLLVLMMTERGTDARVLETAGLRRFRDR